MICCGFPAMCRRAKPEERKSKENEKSSFKNQNQNRTVRGVCDPLRRAAHDVSPVSRSIERRHREELQGSACRSSGGAGPPSDRDRLSPQSGGAERRIQGKPRSARIDHAIQNRPFEQPPDPAFQSDLDDRGFDHRNRSADVGDDEQIPRAREGNLRGRQCVVSRAYPRLAEHIGFSLPHRQDQLDP